MREVHRELAGLNDGLLCGCGIWSPFMGIGRRPPVPHAA